MPEIILDLVRYAERVAFGVVALVGVWFVGYGIWVLARSRARAWRQCARYVGIGILCMLAFKNFGIFNRRVIFEPYDGTRITYIQRNLLWFDTKIALELRHDPEIGRKVWMAEGTDGRWYPYFVEVDRLYEDE